MDASNLGPFDDALGTRVSATFVTHKLVRSDGQGRVNAEVVAGLASAGHRVVVVCSEIDAELAASPGVDWHRVVVPDWLPTTLLRYQVFGFRVGRLLRRLPAADVLQLNGAIAHGTVGGVNVANFVHAHWARSPHHPARGRWGPAPVYRWLFTWLNAAWERRAFHRAERVVAVSEQVRDALVRYVGIDPERIDVIPPGVDAGQFRPALAGEANRLRAELAVADDDFLLLFVGDAQSNRKNLDLILHAMPRWPGRVRLAVIGDVSRSPYPAMADQLGVGGRVAFLGRRTTDLPDLMRGADVFVFPSHYDPFALVVTEAMASGVPVVTAPTVGASGLIRDGENGFVLPNDTDLEPLVAVVERLLADPALRATVGRAARVTAEQHSWAAMADRYAELYARVIADRRGSPPPA
jgi:glycosyltransferase involved in cell wall biosynthesis